MTDVAIAGETGEPCSRCQRSIGAAAVWVCGSCKSCQHMDCFQRWGECIWPACSSSTLPTIGPESPARFDPGPLPLEGMRETGDRLLGTEAGALVELGPGESAIEIPARVSSFLRSIPRIPDRPLWKTRALEVLVIGSAFLYIPCTFALPLIFLGVWGYREMKVDSRDVRAWLVRRAYGHLEVRWWRTADARGNGAGLVSRDVGHRSYILTDREVNRDLYCEAAEVRIQQEENDIDEPECPDNLVLLLILRAKGAPDQRVVLAHCPGRFEDVHDPRHSGPKLLALGQAVARVLRVPLVEAPPKRGRFS